MPLPPQWRVRADSAFLRLPRARSAPRNDNSGVHAINGKAGRRAAACFSVQGIFGGDGIRGAGFGEVGRQNIAGDGAESVPPCAPFFST